MRHASEAEAAIAVSVDGHLPRQVRIPGFGGFLRQAQASFAAPAEADSALSIAAFSGRSLK